MSKVTHSCENGTFKFNLESLTIDDLQLMIQDLDNVQSPIMRSLKEEIVFYLVKNQWRNWCLGRDDQEIITRIAEIHKTPSAYLADILETVFKEIQLTRQETKS